MHLLNFGLNVQPDPLAFVKLQEPKYWNVSQLGYNLPPNGTLWGYHDWIFTTRPGVFGIIPGCANPTGVALIIILTIMGVCSMPFVRRSGRFEVRLQTSCSSFLEFIQNTSAFHQVILIAPDALSVH